MNLHTYFVHSTFKLILFSTILIVSSLYANGQSLKKMTPDVYSQWNKIKNIQVSDSAEVVVYSLEKEIGDKKLAIYQTAKDTTLFFDSVVKYSTDPSGKYIVMTKGLAYDSLRTLKRKKTEKSKLPKDSLTIIDLRSKRFTTIGNIEDFKMPDKYSGYCFYTKKLDKKEAKPITSDNGPLDTLQLDTLPKDTSVQKDKKIKNPCEGVALFIRKLDTGQEDTILQVKDYIFSEEYPVLAYSQCVGDSVAAYDVFQKDLTNDVTTGVVTGKAQITNMHWEKKGRHLALLALDKKSDARQKPYDLYIKAKNDNASINISDIVKENSPNGWVISSDKSITWSESGQRMFFGIAPILPVRDTNLLDDEIVNVEIWHHDAPRLYTQMEATENNDRKKAYTMMYDHDSLSIMQLETLEADRSITSKKGDGRYVLQLVSRPYEKEVTWMGEAKKDFILIDTKTKEHNLILTGEYANPSFSPDGRYIYWWSGQDSIWKTYDTDNSIIGTLGLWSITKFHNEENDEPHYAGPYGIVGWTKDDKYAIVYDRYDMWKINPQNLFDAQQLTNGREVRQIHRWIKTDKEKTVIDSNEVMLLHRFDETTKGDAYVQFKFDSSKYITLLSGDFMLTKNVIKAKKSNACIYTSETFSIFPDLYLSSNNFTDFKKISSANPQQSDYAWGKAELISWTNYRNQRNEGLIYFPPDFNPDKKYPLIVNFYDKSSNELYQHRAPEAHRSTINYSYYTNLGYIIFNPDIKYLTGQPGDDCLNAVESGVDMLVKTGYIDENKIALQGHSWGGYQIAYLLTKSGRYRCAESGAPVVNMVSAYGGIRWESGLSRMFQYEKAQSRLGATLWENPQLYHKNSPIYEMDKMTTPVLIMHNDEDGAVPWYQGIEYYMALRRLGKPAWLLNYNNEPHWPVKWQNRLDFNIRMEQFFNHYLMDESMPLWMKEGNTPIEKGILNKY